MPELKSVADDAKRALPEDLSDWQVTEQHWDDDVMRAAYHFNKVVPFAMLSIRVWPASRNLKCYGVLVDFVGRTLTTSYEITSDEESVHDALRHAQKAARQHVKTVIDSLLMLLEQV